MFHAVDVVVVFHAVVVVFHAVVVVCHAVYRDVVVADDDAVRHVSFVRCGRCCCSIRQSRGRCCWRNTENNKSLK